MHGVSHEETTLRLQLRCDGCKHGRMSNHPNLDQEQPLSSGVTVGEGNEAEQSELAADRETWGVTKDVTVCLLYHDIFLFSFLRCTHLLFSMCSYDWVHCLILLSSLNSSFIEL